MNCDQCSQKHILNVRHRDYKILSKLFYDLCKQKIQINVCKECCEIMIKDMRLEIGMREKYNGTQISIPLDLQNTKSEIVYLDDDSNEYQSMVKKFHNSMDKNIYTILRVEKNINPILLKRFEDIKKKFNVSNEGHYFHGSSNQNYDPILDKGFDINLAKDGALGKGIYFAENASYSDGYTRDIITDKGCVKNMLCCRVVFGKENVNFKKGHSDTYAVYSNEQCYPEYIIYYIHKMNDK